MEAKPFILEKQTASIIVGKQLHWFFLKWDCISHLEFDDAAYQTLIKNYIKKYKRLQWLTDSSNCSSTYMNEMIRVAPADNHKWIIDGILSMVAGTNSSNSSP